jgi:dGTPase
MPIAAEPTSLRHRIDALEDAFLSSAASRSYPARRAIAEDDSPVRTPFTRDRDRIVHSKAFRRLKHKTQVFISPEGDHYRTRLTHTLEASGIARTVARVLGLNEDLTEAIGLGHDLGHPPFGHIGEDVLDRLLLERYGMRFRHNEHSLRVVERLERDGRGLNLTEPVREGIERHTGPEPPSTLEGRIVRLVDRVAYINHDIDDAVRAGVLAAAELPREDLDVLGETGSERIDTLVRDLVATSREAGDIVQGERVGNAMARLREFMFERVYLGAAVRSERERIERILTALFEVCAERPPAALTSGASEGERVADWIAGMTDRYAERAYAELVGSGDAGAPRVPGRAAAVPS